MSFSKNDRKLQLQFGNKFPTDVGLDDLVQVIAVALKSEFGNTPSTLKTLAHLTHSNERAIRNWLDGKNGPSGANLVILMRHSDIVLRAVLELAGRRDLVVAIGLANLRRRLVDAVAEIDGLPSPKRAKKLLK